MPDHDVLVLGGGLAGLSSARDLAHHGLDVLLVEARDRLGGRTWVRRFRGHSMELDFGGTWILPDEHAAIVAELDRYGIATVPTPQPEAFVNVLGEERVDTAELAPAELAALNAAVAGSSGAGSLADVLAGLPARSRRYATAYTRYLTGADPAEVAPHPREAFVHPDHYSDRLAGGTRSLVEALAADAAVPLLLASPVEAVEQTADGVRVGLATGEVLTARAAVVALPLNVLATVDFRPALDGQRAALARTGHAGRSVKVWALVEGVPAIVRGLADEGPIAYLRTERLLPHGRSLLVGFGAGGELDPLDRDAVERAVRHLLPEAVVLACDGHDWNADPFARGTWLASRPGQRPREAAGLAGRLAFAGGDLSPTSPGTLDGAVGSGRDAAAAVRDLLTP